LYKCEILGVVIIVTILTQASPWNAGYASNREAGRQLCQSISQS
jgi:hypothetical protein